LPRQPAPAQSTRHGWVSTLGELGLHRNNGSRPAGGGGGGGGGGGPESVVSLCTGPCFDLQSTAQECATLACAVPGWTQALRGVGVGRQFRPCRAYPPADVGKCFCGAALERFSAQHGSRLGPGKMVAAHPACAAYADGAARATAWLVVGALVVVAVNELLKLGMGFLARYEKQHAC
jgi:hypothetical protein